VKVGFTGTQQGCTQAQKASLREVLESHPAEEFHHGDCIGADAQAHSIMVRRARVVIHPSNRDDKRAFCRGAAEVRPAKPPLDRNRDIVDDTEVLVACPRGEDEELRSGTWATIRYARKKGRRVMLVLPDGRVVE
jgi:hypothetical protein